MRPGFQAQRLLAVFAALVCAVVVLDLVFPPPLKRAMDVSALVLDRNGRWVHAFTNPQGRWRFPVSLDDIDPIFIERLIEIEDRRFYRHIGVDPLAMARAIADAIRTGQIDSGASTITMQTARLLEPRPRGVGSKLVEIVRAIQIERRLQKEEILELYLTLAPYGGNIEGLRAATLVYFGHEPQRLTLAEQALLIALPQAPEARRPDRRPDAAKRARGRVLNEMVLRGQISETAAGEAASEDIALRRRDFPRSAYHAARALSADPTGEIRSTLDLDLQQRAEDLVAATMRTVQDGATASAMVVRTSTREVLASVGSSSISAPGGWIDLTRAKRSPGSLLKPLIYALAFDDGTATADTIIDDRPRLFGDYQPENFDRQFRGEVTVRDALQHSLNVPAVVALDSVGARRFALTLTQAGAPIALRRRPGRSEGLALALGGGGLSLRDIATLYAGLAGGGVVRPLRDRLDTEESDVGVKLVSIEAAGRIKQILQGTPSLEGRVPARLSANAPVIAYKTGTSYGYRDSWAAGYAGDLTIVVWIGRADGAPRPGVTGRSAAAPLLFALFDVAGETAGEGEIRTRETNFDDDQPTPRLRFDRGEMRAPPRIVFPPAGAELFVDDYGASGKGVVLSASGGSGGYRWYEDGREIQPEGLDGRGLWRPAAPGFYRITVVDSEGAAQTANVRVFSGS